MNLNMMKSYKSHINQEISTCTNCKNDEKSSKRIKLMIINTVAYKYKTTRRASGNVWANR